MSTIYDFQTILTLFPVLKFVFENTFISLKLLLCHLKRGTPYTYIKNISRILNVTCSTRVKDSFAFSFLRIFSLIPLYMSLIQKIFPVNGNFWIYSLTEVEKAQFLSMALTNNFMGDYSKHEPFGSSDSKYIRLFINNRSYTFITSGKLKVFIGNAIVVIFIVSNILSLKQRHHYTQLLNLYCHYVVETLKIEFLAKYFRIFPEVFRKYNMKNLSIIIVHKHKSLFTIISTTRKSKWIMIKVTDMSTTRKSKWIFKEYKKFLFINPILPSEYKNTVLSFNIPSHRSHTK
ncbi:hypothetical protein H8356DRAFT_1362656 [Neocallimastix lanati (nom. inval.)]|nr:hypothetical protein H8356DRAFT_1362656 [Neocallimastix sp. JGI-2020a]